MKITSLSVMLILYIVVHKNAHAQISKEQGFVVLNNGDTIRGWIQSQNWKVNPRKINFFYPGKSTARTVYHISDLKYFEISGKEAYERAGVKIVLKTVNCVDPEDVEHYSDTVFLRYIIRGKSLSLYELCGLGQTVYYFRLEGQDDRYYQQLFNSDFRIHPELLQTYKEQLAATATTLNMPEVIPGIYTAPYKVEELANAITVLNSGHSNVYFKPNTFRIKPWKWIFGTQVGFPKVRLRNQFNSFVARRFFVGSELGITAAMQSASSAVRFRGQLGMRLGNYRSKTDRGFWAPQYFLKYQNVIPSIHAVFPISERTGMSFYSGVGLAYSMIRYESRYFDGFKWAGGNGDENNIATILFVAAHIRSRLEVKFSYLDRDHGITYHPVSNYWTYDLPACSLAISYIW